IDAGYDHSCATLKNGEVYCFGDNTNKHLGSSSPSSHLPIKVALNDHIIKTFTGWDNSCFLNNKGLLYCAGVNSSGQFGLGHTNNNLLPTANSNYAEIVNLAPIIQFIPDQKIKPGLIPLYASHTYDPNGDEVQIHWQLISQPSQSLATFSDPFSKKTEINFDQIGNYLIRLSASDASLSTYSEFNVEVYQASQKRAQSLHAFRGTCVLLTNGSLDCTGPTQYGGSVKKPWNFYEQNILDYDQNTDFSCAVLANHQLECYGSNGYGQLGLNNKTTSNSPSLVSTTLLFTAVSTGRRHTCAITTGKELYCFGSNQYGQLGDGTFIESLIPKKVNGLKDIIKVETGELNSCALDANGSLSCFGHSGHGDLGIGDNRNRTTPQLISKHYGDILDISMGRRNSCFINHENSL
ncbi:hypothetical protein MJH12_18190, partial [bacterium]|nr:hypothetical protein [bacterium]